MKRNTSRREFLAGVGVGIATSTTAGCLGAIAGDGGLPSFTVASVNAPSNLQSLLSIDEIQEDVATNVGSEYELSIVQRQSSVDIINQMAAGEIDIGTVSHVSLPNAIIKDAVPGGLTAVAANFRDAHPGYFAFPVLSMEGSGITAPEDLEGKKIGVSAIGSGGHSVPWVILVKNGLDPDSVDWVEMPLPSAGPGIREGKIDAAPFPPPFNAIERKKGEIEEVANTREAIGEGYDFSFLGARNSVIENDRQALEAFLEDYRDLSEYANEPENRPELVSLSAEEFKASKEFIDAYFLTEKGGYRPPDAHLDVNALNSVIDVFAEFGLVEENIDIGEYATNEYIPD